MLNTSKYLSFPLLLLLMWAGAFVVVGPQGEFAVNDDWAYAKNVYHLSVNNHFVVDEWPAMTLVSQTFYGFVFAKIFGFSFVVLRCSILLLGLLSTLVLYKLITGIAENRFAGFIAAAGFCFNTIYMALSFTFMTDVFFCAFIVFAVNALVKYHQTQLRRHYIFFCIYSVVAVLDRQHGLLLPLLMVLPVLWKKKLNMHRLISAFLPFAICLLVHRGYRSLLDWNHIPHNIQGLGNLRETLRQMPFDAFWIHAGDILLVSGWLLLPLVCLKIGDLGKFNLQKSLIMLAIFVLMILIVYKDWIFYPQGNVARYLEVGPRVVNGEVYAPRQSWGRTCVKIVSLVSVSLAIYLSVKKIRSFRIDPLYTGLLLVLILYFVFVVCNLAYFDRYALPFALFLLIYISGSPVKFSEKAAYIALMMVICIYTISLFEVKDHMDWQRTRWDAIHHLEKRGYGPHDIDGGFEYNAWYKPGKGFEPGKSWWWVDRDDYMISTRWLPGYVQDTFFVYKRYLPWTLDTVFVLKKTGEDEH